ncbi:hypothetical protein GCK72_023255 [Caenorhabditis remanei]|uniref:Carrier domain-containing protein n=1 Tax=Caenorhabditis remanei TaxID=31234 RepID=A0A6A5FVZ2_CAERE|nr:hypothetical protein GCK72_023255 [Caenorhabditis remanei]KAF1746798.1 hypothetical protein GCK72_023255 [Caenorhabditis remanei]
MSSTYDEVITADTVEGKVQQLIAFWAARPAEEIDNDFNFKAGANKDRVDLLNASIAEALSSVFNVPTESIDVEPLSTVQDIINRVNNA